MEDQQKSKIALVVQSALLYVLAFMLTTIWHEFGHAIVGVLAGGHPTMYHNSVVGDESVVMSLAASLAVKMAGPLFSLFQAGVFSWLFVRSTRRTLVPLFVL
ncbi:MAG: M50 family metallopeptidase, partial [Bacteroidetes bacterium]|nr:M50 family metallopeptidase [Bacteroidota bacterium]